MTRSKIECGTKCTAVICACRTERMWNPNGHSNNSEFSVRSISSYCFFILKINNFEFFYDTWNHIGRENSEFKVSFFPTYPTTITLSCTCTLEASVLGSENSEFQVIIFFLDYTEKITRNFSKSAKALNLGNMVQVCLAPSNIHRVNKDFSYSVEDCNFGVLSYRF